MTIRGYVFVHKYTHLLSVSLHFTCSNTGKMYFKCAYSNVQRKTEYKFSNAIGTLNFVVLAITGGISRFYIKPRFKFQRAGPFSIFVFRQISIGGLFRPYSSYFV